MKHKNSKPTKIKKIKKNENIKMSTIVSLFESLYNHTI